MEKPARRHLSSRGRHTCPVPADGGHVGLALDFAPGADPGARMTRKNLRNVFLGPEGSRPLGIWELRLQQGSWSCSQVSLCLRPILPSEGESPHCFQDHTPGLAHTRSSRNARMKPGPAGLQASMLLGELTAPD